MRIDILYFDGCPSYAELLPRLHELVAEAGFDADVITPVRLDTPDEARTMRFLGSPTVRVNGVDVDPTAADREGFGWKCRIYRVAGRQVHVPPDEWIRAALAQIGEPDRTGGVPPEFDG